MRIIDTDHVIYTFEPGLKAVDTIKDGETVSIHTHDCFLQQVQSEQDLVTQIDFSQVNPATGPFYVENADIGDVLKIDILDIRVADKGAVVVLPGGGLLGGRVKDPMTRIVEIQDGMVDFLGFKRPIDPMIGVIGVSPGEDQLTAVTGTPGNHGGNMDTTDVRIGNTLYFPVREAGAMLALGDCHAVMGDGEICISGLEVQADVVLKVSVIKNVDLNWPIVESEDEIIVITSETTLEETVMSAGFEMTDLVRRVRNLKWEEAYMFNSLFVDFKISQVVNPHKTVRAVVKKDVLTMDDILRVKSTV